jgi:signal transduction histidine kinase
MVREAGLCDAEIAVILDPDPPIQTRKPVLLGAAFVAMLAMIGLAASAVWRSATTAQDRVAELHASSGAAASALSAIRTDVYQTAVLTRDYLLDPDRSRAPEYNEQFDQIRVDLDSAFATLQNLAHDNEQAQALKHLHAEVQSYVAPTAEALDWTPEEKLRYGSRLLRLRVRRREEIFALVSRAETLIRNNVERERQRITHADQEFRRSFVWIMAAALGIGVVIAAATLTQIMRLERQSEAAEVKLRELSARLRTAQEDERKHLSRELHDEVGQMLTGLRMELAALARLNWSTDADVAARITHAKATAELTLKTVRNIAMVARPSMLDDLGLGPAISWQTKEFERRTGVEVDLAIDPEADAPGDRQRTCIYRIVQEALTNCARHASATRIQIRLNRSGGKLRLSIRDNGSGFDRAVERKGGMGLVSMEERVRELGGRIAVKSAPGAGTQIEVELPAAEAAEVKA